MPLVVKKNKIRKKQNKKKAHKSKHHGRNGDLDPKTLLISPP